MTGDEAEQATVAAVDAAVLAEQPYLRIIHGMGTGRRARAGAAGGVAGPAGRAVTASRPATRAAPASPSWSSPREHDPRRDRRAGARQRRPGRASSARRWSSSGPARTIAGPVRSTAAPTGTSPSFPRRAATTASSATRAATCSRGHEAGGHGLSHRRAGGRPGASASPSPSARPAPVPIRSSRSSARWRWRRTGSPGSCSRRTRPRARGSTWRAATSRSRPPQLYGLGFAPAGQGVPRRRCAARASRTRCCSRPGSRPSGTMAP